MISYYSNSKVILRSQVVCVSINSNWTVEIFLECLLDKSKPFSGTCETSFYSPKGVIAIALCRIDIYLWSDIPVVAYQSPQWPPGSSRGYIWYIFQSPHPSILAPLTATPTLNSRLMVSFPQILILFITQHSLLFALFCSLAILLSVSN